MDKLLENLNKEQKAAVLHTSGPLAIIAGAGSGKTRTLTRKLAYLANKPKNDPTRLLAVTFTNKAAAEMRDRVSKYVDKKGGTPLIKTYHALCVKILRSEIGFFGYPKNFNILDTLDQKQILTPIYKKYGISPRTFSYNNMISQISKNKMHSITPEMLLEEAKNDTERVLANVYGDYTEQIKRIKSLDFDDLLFFVYRLFRESKDAKARWSKAYDYVLVDEFQDTSFIQYEIIQTLAANNNITIVGDPDQTIYTWRWADVNLIRNFKKYFKGAKVIKLEQNYRSTQTILDAANLLIMKNKDRDKKNLYTEAGHGDIIEFFHGFSDEAEARWIVQKIQELKRNKTQLKEIAILYRANYLSNTIEKALINGGINYVIFGGVKFYQRQEIKNAVAFLKTINNGDEVSLRRIINIPSRKIGTVAVTKLIAFSNKMKMPLFEAIKTHFKELPLSLTQRNELAKLINNVGKYKMALKSNPISLVIDKFMREIGYVKPSSSVEEMARLDNLREFVRSIKAWETKNKNLTLDDFLAEISLYTDQDDVRVSNDYITLMTVHAAKGLEYKNIFIAGFSDGVFPSQRAIDEGGVPAVEEERRLAYVAVTRAKERVFISNSRGYAIDYKTQKKPSRFIEEMGINIRDFTNEFIAPKNIKENYSKKGTFIAGDRVSHDKFGEGEVINVKGELIEIVFKDPHGVKTLMKNHKSIERVR